MTPSNHVVSPSCVTVFTADTTTAMATSCVPTPRRAQIVKFKGLSAHADRQDLIAYVRAIQPSPSKVILVHGEEKQALSLAMAIQAEYPRIEVSVPHVGSTLEI